MTASTTSMTTKLDLPISDRDQAALDAMTRAGLLIVPTIDSIAELSPQRAVFLSLARHIARVRARLENIEAGSATELELKSVRFEWPTSWDPAIYPIAVLSEVSTIEADTYTATPVRVTDPVTKDLVDAISADDSLALWCEGEDVGEGSIIVFAAFESHANAIANAIRSSLRGNFSPFAGAVLPLPEASLPEAFRGLVDPVARVQPASGGAVEKSAQAEGNAWRVDVHFSWQARRLTARDRLPDLKPQVFVAVGDPSTAKEII